MPSSSSAAKFIEEAVNHPEWLKTIEGGQPDTVVALANEHGFACSFDDLKEAARGMLPGDAPDKEEVDEAASGMSELESDTGYGNDTGYAALYGVAGTILKM